MLCCSWRYQTTISGGGETLTFLGITHDALLPSLFTPNPYMYHVHSLTSNYSNLNNNHFNRRTKH